MLNKKYPLLLFLFLTLSLSTAAVQPAPVVSSSATTITKAIKLVDSNDPEFARRLDRAKAKANFFKLANHFESQINKFFCGPAAAVIVLNSLRLSDANKAKPLDPTAYDKKASEYLPNKDYVPLFEKYTQHNFFTEATDKVKSKMEVFGKPVKGSTAHGYGYTLREFSETLKAHGLAVQLQIVADDSNEKKISAELIKTLSTADTYLVVNYHRPALGQKGAGHISPVGAYDKTSDSFLVMDVNPNAANWVWVKAPDLIAAMRTKDEKENRGYVIVAEKN